MLRMKTKLEKLSNWWSSITWLSDDYAIEYQNPYDEVVTYTIWKTHRYDDLPFSEIITQGKIK